MRATFALPILALALGALANPPACLLAAVGQQDSPHDLSAICGDDAKDVQAALDKDCSKDSKSVAQEAFLSTCSSAGSSVAAYTPSSTSGSSSASATGSGSSSDASDTASAFESGASATASGSSAGASGVSGANDVVVAATFMMGAAAIAGLAIGL